jgi:hypothetical protein
MYTGLVVYFAIHTQTAGQPGFLALILKGSHVYLLRTVKKLIQLGGKNYGEKMKKKTIISGPSCVSTPDPLTAHLRKNLFYEFVRESLQKLFSGTS